MKRFGSTVLGACVLLVVGCAPTDDSADEAAPTLAAGSSEVLGTVSSALSNGSVQWINGTYTGCVSRTGAWSARVSGVATMTNPALSVVTNDATCVLTMTGIYADQAYTATPAIVLGTSYAAVASPFGTGAAQFTANAKLDSVAFASNFQITIVYGDTTTMTTDAVVNSAYATVASSTVSTGVTPPTYAIDVSGVAYQVDALKVVTGVSGSVKLTDGAVTGTTYAIDMGTLPATPTYLQVSLAWTAAVLTQKPIAGANPVIPAAQFGIIGTSLFSSSQVRTLIVQRVIAGVAAYQVMRITFAS